MITPTPVTPLQGDVVLDEQFAANRVDYMRRMGAKNVDPPLVRSAYLKNKTTGMIFPWSPGLAEQRDIMVNCDAAGNEAPAAWRQTVNPEPYSDAERMEMEKALYQSIQGNKYTVPMPDTMKAKLNDPDHQAMPHGAKPMQEYFREQNAAVVADMERLLN